MNCELLAQFPAKYERNHEGKKPQQGITKPTQYVVLNPADAKGNGEFLSNDHLIHIEGKW